MSVLFMPPRPQGSAEAQLERQYAYLFQMAQQLNLAMEESEKAAVEQRTAAEQGLRQRETQAYQTLRSMILKTADVVRREMDRLSVELRGEYVAQSEFGSYVEELSGRIEADPEALTQYYRFASDLKADTAAVSEAFASYKTGTEGYIRTGVVYREGEMPVYGVAVGQNLRVTEVDGEEVVAQNNFRATFTANRLSFWQDAEEVAFVSNNRLYITRITVLEGMDVGQWKVSGVNGLAFQWIGG